jgi:hypothetical protein
LLLRRWRKKEREGMEEGKGFLQGLAEESPRGAKAQESKGSTRLLTNNGEQEAPLVFEAETAGASTLGPRV